MTAQDALQFIRENDVKFIRLAFVDLYGQLKNIAILPDQLATAFESGVPVDVSDIDGFEKSPGDLLLVPDPDTLCILPWRPHSGGVCRLLCWLRTADGQPFEGDSRLILKRAVDHAAAMGLQVRVGTDCEFTLLKLDEHGEATDEPFDRGGYLDVAPLDKCEDVRREICLTLEQMGIRPESSHHERGHGQNEVDFHRAEALVSADHYVAFMHAVRAVSQRYGAHASFQPRPVPGGRCNGLTVNMSLYRDQRNLMRMEQGELDAQARAAMAGVLKRLRETTLFLNPLPQSYARLADPLTPDRLAWTFGRGDAALRVPLPQDRFARMQLRSADPMMNAYIGFALLLEAALEGVERSYALELKPDEGGDMLPQTLQEALRACEQSELVQRVLPRSVRDSYIERANIAM